MKESGKALVCWCAFTGFLFLATPFPALGGDYPDTVVDEISVPAGPAGMCLSPDGSKLYLACATAQRVVQIDTSSNSLIPGAEIPVLISAHLSITPITGDYLFVVNHGADSVTIFETTGNSEIRTIPFGNRGPTQSQVTPDEKYLLVCDHDAGSVSVIDIQDPDPYVWYVRRIIPISSQYGPGDIAITSDGQYALFTACSDSEVSVFDISDPDPANWHEVTTLDVDTWPVGIALTPDESLGYVTNAISDTVSVIDTSDPDPVNWATLPISIAVGDEPSRVAVTSDGHYAYVTNYSADTVSVISTTSNTVVDTITVGGYPADVLVLPNGNLYVSSRTSNYVAVIGGAAPRLVQIDIKPGSDENPINLCSQGLIPVAILTTEHFDATTVDPSTVELAGSTVAIRGKADKYLASVSDVDGDGDDDLMLHIPTENLQLESGATEAILTGQTYGGELITGSDTIVIVQDAPELGAFVMSAEDAKDQADPPESQIPFGGCTSLAVLLFAGMALAFSWLGVSAKSDE